MQATSTQPQPARKASPRRGSRSRTWLLATALAIGTLVLLLGGPFAVDQYLHAKHDAYETPNSQGYRGAVLPSKAPGELRVAIVGESAAYGYGLITEYSLGPQLERKLQAALDPRPVSLVNLAANGDSSPCYAPTLAHYDWLQPDVVLIDAGYNDSPSTLGRPVSTCYRQRNRIFALTGYWPVSDLYVREKLYTIIYGSAERGYQAAGQIAPIIDEPNFVPQASADAEAQAIADFSANLDSLIQGQLALGRRVVYMTQPYLNSFHRRQQVAVRDTLAHFASDPHFAYVDLGDALDLSNPDMSFDRMHPTAEGNDVLSTRLVAPIKNLVQRAP
jgi:lysophospholipase L1-like esterase